jgi:hypothetical protein
MKHEERLLTVICNAISFAINWFHLQEINMKISQVCETAWD